MVPGLGLTFESDFDLNVYFGRPAYGLLYSHVRQAPPVFDPNGWC